MLGMINIKDLQPFKFGSIQ